MDGGRVLSRGVFSSRSEARLSRPGFLVCARLHVSGDAHARLPAWDDFLEVTSPDLFHLLGVSKSLTSH
jgi:hypothetical protein